MRGCRTEHDAIERAKLIAGLAIRVTSSVGKAEVIIALRKVADAKGDAVTIEAACDVAREVIGGHFDTDSPHSKLTVRELARQWYENELFANFRLRKQLKLKFLKPNTVLRTRTSLDRIVFRVCGDRPAAELAHHADRILEQIGPQLTGDTPRVYLSPYKRLCDIAFLMGIATKTLPKDWMPEKEGTRSLQRIYPSEDAKHLACREVPLWRRIMDGFANRNGSRGGELIQMTIDQFDLHGTRFAHLHGHQTKTSEYRDWLMLDGTDLALIAWVHIARCNAAPTDAMFVNAQGKPFRNVRKFPAWLRRDFKTAGITRRALFEETKESRPLEPHDRRATFVAVKLAIGWSDDMVKQRTGHKNSEQLKVYKRSVQAHKEAVMARTELADFVPLHLAIPELKAELLAMGYTPQQLDPTATQPPTQPEFSHGLATEVQKPSNIIGMGNSIVESVLGSEASEMTKKAMITQQAIPSSPVQPGSDGESVAFQTAVELAAAKATIATLERVLIAVVSQHATPGGVAAALQSELLRLGKGKPPAES